MLQPPNPTIIAHGGNGGVQFEAARDHLISSTAMAITISNSATVASEVSRLFSQFLSLPFGAGLAQEYSN
jgi:hypothetical protein